MLTIPFSCRKSKIFLSSRRSTGTRISIPFSVTMRCFFFRLRQDLRFLQEVQPSMIGVGPYITHTETPFADQPSGDLLLSLKMIALLRLMFPKALIPATTAFGSMHPQGRELALKAGGNVMMPNLSPTSVRKLYDLYENKICTGEEATQCRGCLEARIKAAGYRIAVSVGDSLNT